MSLARHIFQAPSRLLSVLAFVSSARCHVFRTQPRDGFGLSDAILCDIGVSRCLLQAGFCQPCQAD